MTQKRRLLYGAIAAASAAAVALDANGKIRDYPFFTKSSVRIGPQLMGFV